MMACFAVSWVIGFLEEVCGNGIASLEISIARLGDRIDRRRDGDRDGGLVRQPCEHTLRSGGDGGAPSHAHCIGSERRRSSGLRSDAAEPHDATRYAHDESFCADVTVHMHSAGAPYVGNAAASRSWCARTSGGADLDGLRHEAAVRVCGTAREDGDALREILGRASGGLRDRRGGGKKYDARSTIA